MKRRDTLAAAAALAAAPWAAMAAPDGAKVLRVSFPVAETGFDPARVSDVYSATINAHIFEGLLGYDHLARPVKLRPRLAAEMPQVSDDYKVWTVKIRPGVLFSDDPAFKGVKRELVAQDFVYSFKRFADPAVKSPNWPSVNEFRIVGLAELRTAAVEAKKPFDYDTDIPGLKALDRHTLQITLGRTQPRFIESLAIGNQLCPVAREVVEAYGDKIMEHPVGTGPFRLAEWRRSSRIVLERNPGYREVFYDEEAPAGDARSQAIAAQLKGRRMPMLDRVEIAIIEESQPRWLSFLNEQTDLMERLPNEFAPVVIPNDKLAPNLAKRGITMDRAPMVDITLAALFNQDNPVVGGYTPEKVALRRAIALAYDSAQEIRLVRKAQAVPAQTAVAPLAFGYNPALKTSMSDHDPARARALLDLYGYVDRDGDGWRDQPDGSALVLEYATQPDQASRQLAELWEKSMKAVGLKIVFKVAKWPENLKASRAGKLMMWGVAWSATTPDADTFLALAYGPNKGGANHARFALKEFDALYDRQKVLPDGPERERVIEEASKLMVAYVPYKLSCHRIATDLMQPWVIGFRRNPFVREFYKFLDVDPAIRAKEAP